MVYKNTTDTSVYIQTVMTVAWVLFPLDSGMTAPQAAGVIHSDFEKGFIRAETVSILIRSFGFPKDFVSLFLYCAHLYSMNTKNLSTHPGKQCPCASPGLKTVWEKSHTLHPHIHTHTGEVGACTLVNTSCAYSLILGSLPLEKIYLPALLWLLQLRIVQEGDVMLFRFNVWQSSYKT
jgi:hypothetical protein